ncbi:MAG: HAD-IIA family hydrolase [Chloroflexi bacterium]|nr:HAD-IIA family hydrolase [Chloroflexota bacterium]
MACCASIRWSSTLVDKPRGIILDLDGTIYRGARIIPGARETIERMRKGAHPLIFATNAIESVAEHVEKLAGLGIAVRPDAIINSTFVLIQRLEREMPRARVFCLGDPPLIEQLAPHFEFSEDPNAIDVVIASTDRSFDFRKLSIGFHALRKGARFWATNAEPTWQQEDDEIPDAGAIIGALEGCSGRKLELIAGKPSTFMGEIALERLNQRAHECLLIGDNLTTDIAMGQRVGIPTVLVMTGLSKRADLERAPVKPDYVLESIADVPRLLEDL